MSQTINNIDYSLVKEWNGGLKGELFFTPDEIVRDWRITLDAEFEITNDNIWGAKVVSHVGDRYILAPTDENRQYYPNQTNTITIVAQATAEDSPYADNLTFYENASDISPTSNPTPEPISEPDPGDNNNTDFGSGQFRYGEAIQKILFVL